MAAIPMQMPSAESAARSRRMRMPRLAKAATSEALRRDASRADGSTCVLLYPAVLELDAPVHRGGELVVVRDDRDGGAVAIEVSQQRDDLGTCCAVEIARRLIREDECRTADERARDGGALALAA